MVAAWETLFHLSNFMKHLLLEVIPKENVDCPKYVQDSLYDLLSTTLDCLDLLTNGKKEVASHKISFQKAIHETASSSVSAYKKRCQDKETYKNIVENSNKDEFTLSNRSYITKSSAESNIQTIRPFKEMGTNKIGTPSLITTYKSTVIPTNFRSLSDTMLLGASWGYYCLLCDISFNNANDWNKHCEDISHISKVKGKKVNYCYCDKCNLHVFGSVAIASVLVEFHSNQHTENVNAYLTMNEQPGNCDSKEKIKQTNTEKRQCYVFRPKFKKIHKELLLNSTKEGYYCKFCDSIYFTAETWGEHFKAGLMHRQLEGAISEDKFKKCMNCRFTVFANGTDLEILMDYHMKGHLDAMYNNQEKSHLGVEKAISDETLLDLDFACGDEPKVNAFSSTSSLTTESDQTEKSSEYVRGDWARECDTSHHKRAQSSKNKNYEFTTNFLNTDTEIHRQNLVGISYCRPCDYTSKKIARDWERHCLNKKHVKFMNSPHFKNVEGECSHCSFSIIGSERCVEEYMKYHNTKHSKVLSYSVKPVIANSSTAEQTDELPPKKSSRKKNTRKDIIDDKPIYYNDLATSDQTISGSCEESHLVNVAPKQQGRNNLNSGTKAEDETVISNLKEIYKSRFDAIQSQDSSPFGAYCIPCEVLIESGFDWIDHLDSCEHNSKKCASDEEIFISKVKLTLFGNKQLINFL